MCDGYSLQHWQYEIIRSLQKHGIELTLVILNDNDEPRTPFFRKILRYKYRYLLFNLYNRFILRPKSKRAIDISAEIQEIEAISCKTNNHGYSQYFENDDIEKIKAKELDFVLRFGFNIIRGDILESARYGIWSFHHDDEQKYRGTGSVYKEILYNDPVNGAILQRLTNRIDAGVILKKGYFQTVKHSLKGSFDNVLYNTVSWPLQVCIDIQNGVAGYIEDEPSTSAAPIKKTEGNFNTFRLLCKLFFNKLKFHYKELFFTERWIVGVSDEKIESIYENGNLANVTWLEAGKRYRYFADPFTIDFDETRLLLFFEDYNYKTRKGIISSSFYNKTTQEFSPVVEVLEKPHHLSFPYIFNHEGNWYLMPESSENKELSVYRIEKDGSLSFYKELLKIDAIDTSLFQYNDIWWLFFTRKHNSNSELHAYYSKDIWGPYEPHKNNPVKTDIRSARPAGSLFYVESDLIRPSQNSAKYYGSRIEFNKISKLDSIIFEEERTQIIEPSYSRTFNRGIHTICSAGNYTVIDQKKHTFIFQSFKYQLKRKFKALFTRSSLQPK